MKVYTDRKEYEKDLSYWSNACGDLHHDGKWIDEADLPDVLKDAYNRLWTEGNGSYNYLCEYQGKLGIAMINEYHEFTEEGEIGEKNNYEQAVKAAQELEKTDFPIESIFIGKEMGFPGTTPDGTDGDYATELVVFMNPEKISKEQYDQLADYLYDNAYVK